MRERTCDILVAGGGLGGVAAALAAARLGRNVILTEETDWLGGQLTSQAVSCPDESRYIESFGCTRSYRALREGIRSYYRRHYPLLPHVAENPHFNPGNGWVSHLCQEPRVGLAVLNQMLAPHVSAGRIEVLLRHKPVGAETDGDTVSAVSGRGVGMGAVKQRVEALAGRLEVRSAQGAGTTWILSFPAASPEVSTSKPRARPVVRITGRGAEGRG